jgi:hypothetical protein
VKWEPGGQDSYIVESPDGELTLVLQSLKFLKGELQTCCKFKSYLIFGHLRLAPVLLNVCSCSLWVLGFCSLGSCMWLFWLVTK